MNKSPYAKLGLEDSEGAGKHLPLLINSFLNGVNQI